MQGKRETICLTNKTAILLRERARKMKSIHLAVGIFLSVMMAFVTVIQGIVSLKRAPVLIICTVLTDIGISIHARTQYLTLTAQAICTEAAARSMREENIRKKRREQALSDLKEIREDVRQAERAKEGTGGHRRRRQAVFQVLENEGDKEAK